jgi:heptosyltransferase-2
MKKYLIIQTAFIGDVILATPLVEKILSREPDARIDMLVRRGNEGLLRDHPGLNRLLVLDKGSSKWRNVVAMIRQVRQTRYDELINLQRFWTTGVISLFARAKRKTGFDKNPLSLFYHRKVKHTIGDGTHEIERNLRLLAAIMDSSFVGPALYPREDDYRAVARWQDGPYVCIAPASVWYTKQFLPEKWMALIDRLPPEKKVYLIGGPSDREMCEDILNRVKHSQVCNLAGSLSFLETAALMEKASMNYVNDSAPLHIASAMNAPVRAVFCSTVPRFGFYPVSDDARSIEISYPLYCRPCGLHGFKACPEGHFRCARDIDIQQMLT